MFQFASFTSIFKLRFSTLCRNKKKSIYFNRLRKITTIISYSLRVHIVLRQSFLFKPWFVQKVGNNILFIKLLCIIKICRNFYCKKYIYIYNIIISYIFYIKNIHTQRERGRGERGKRERLLCANSLIVHIEIIFIYNEKNYIHVLKYNTNNTNIILIIIIEYVFFSRF